MAEYIERETVLEILRQHSVGTWRGIPCYPDEIKSVAKAVKSIPAADVAPVVHGRWIDGADSFGAKRGTYRVCSRCHTAIPNCAELTDDMWHGCPRCLARMDGDGFTEVGGG